ncbi:trehalose transporter 1-like protein [Lycorma delicatula]|uniref:trehalose transporter 1-like protein n=1 Tax=Lycorma delicatula TaxID=130591 RepID=UPI003F50EBB2
MDIQQENNALRSSEDGLPNSNHKNSSESEGSLRSTLAQVATVAGLGVFFFTVGLVLSMPSIIIGALLNNDKESFSLDINEASWFGSIIFISQPLAALSSGFYQDMFGRKQLLLFINIPIFIGWILLYFSSSVLYLNCAAILLGLSLGSVEAPAFSYIGEMSEPRLRGMMSLLIGIFTSIGMLIEYFIGALTNWHNTCAISAMFSVLAIIFMTLIPESPMWLLKQDRYTEAERALCWLRGWVHPSKVRKEFLALQEYIMSSDKKSEDIEASNQERDNYLNGRKNHEKCGIFNKLKVLAQANVYRPLRMIMIYMTISYSVSLWGVRQYLIYIFQVIGMPLDPNWVMVITVSWQIIGYFIGMICLRLFGKRVVNFLSLFICVVCCYAIGISLMMGISLMVPFSFFNILFFAAGFGIIPLPWTLISEVFPLKGRGISIGVTGALSYVLMFIVIKTYPILSSWFQLHGSLYIYGTIGLFGLVYTYFYLPETEGKTLLEIEEFFKDKKPQKK